MKKIISIILSLLSFVFLLDILFISIGYIDLFSFQTRGTEWYKLSNEELLHRLLQNIVFLIMIFIYFKFIESILPEKGNEKRIEFSKCPKCKKTFNYKDLDKGKCPKCKNVDTIDLEKYFEIYPKEKKK